MFGARGGWGIGAILLVACGGDSEPNEAGAAAVEPGGCVPGASQACTGPGGCEGGQICADDGSRFGPCDCSLPAGAEAGAPGTPEVEWSPAPIGGSGGIPSTAGAGGFAGDVGDAPDAGGGFAAGGFAGGAPGKGGSLPGTGGSPAVPGSCAGGSLVATCGNGVRDPGEICYAPPRIIPFAAVDTAAWGLAIADIDGDGRPEIVAMASTGSTLRLHVVSSDGAGNFSALAPVVASTEFSSGGLIGPMSPYVALGEVTGDAHLDAVVSFNYVNSHLVIVPGTSDGSLGTAGTPQASTAYGPVALGNADADDLLDLFHVDLNNGTVRVRPATSPGVFGAASSTSPNNMASIWGALADLTGNGWPEIISRNGTDITIGLNDGTGLYSFWSKYAVPAATGRPLAADLDADGLVDLVVGTTAAEVRVMRGNGFGGVIGDSQPHPVANSSVNVAFPVDVTNDDCLDLVAFHAGGLFSVLPALDPGRFDVYRTFPGLAGAVEAGDLNGDGVVDFASVGVQDSVASVRVVLSNP
jgi:hypothetical protein